MMQPAWAVLALCVALVGCGHTDAHAGHDDDGGHQHADAGHGQTALDWEQLALGCSIMGSGESAHVMCNHGHSLSLRNDPLYERRLYLQSHGMADPTELDLLHAMDAGHGTQLPGPLSGSLHAVQGERVRIRVVSYGPQFHTFHVHGHVWLDRGKLTDVRTLGPAEVYDFAEFYAGAHADSPDPRSGPGQWMVHCHVETHMATGMWTLLDVLPKDSPQLPAPQTKFPGEVPLPVGGAGQTVDVWVVAAEVPLAISRVFVPATKSLDTLERMARVYIPLGTEAQWQQATAGSVAAQMATRKRDWLPWVLSVRQGTTVRVHLRNLMPNAPVSLHPHGVAASPADEGTMPAAAALPGGQAVEATWLADSPGTWPLHDHARTIENVGRGLFAALVVYSPEEEQTLQRDYVLFMHDYDMDWLMGAETPAGGGH